MRVAHSFVNQPVPDNELPTLNAPAFSPYSTLSTRATQQRSFNTDEAAQQILRGGYRHYDRNGDGKIELSFTLDPAFSAPQKVAIRKALQAWQDVANIAFKEGSTQLDGSITFKAAPNTSGGKSHLPDWDHADMTTTIGTKGASETPKNGDYFLLTAIHEVGHAIGLGHPGDYEESVDSYTKTPYKQDTRAHSVMSYWPETNQPGHDFKERGPSVLMKDDIASGQKLYGVNFKTRNTDTVYGFNATTGDGYFSLNSANDKPVFSIWDGGGNDTLDFSGFYQYQKINLRAESYSSVGGLKGNVSIAKGVVMENAIGGSGDDDINGNEVGNRLRGGGGADRLRGGAGADIFVYDKASDSTLDSPDDILDFTSGSDKIDLSGLFKNYSVKHFKVVEQFTGRAGEIVLSHDQNSGNGSLSVDLTGRGKADVFIRSVGVIQASDIVTGEDVAQPNPTPIIQGSGGHDTLDFSGARQNQTIDLRRSASSGAGGLRDHVSMAEDGLVANAIGGSGRDRIIGNEVDNTLTGGGGGDVLWGVGGRNTFKYAKVTDSLFYDPDRLMDFASGEDTIDLTALATELGTPLRLVDAYTGRIGDTVVKHDPRTGRSVVGIDLLGRRHSDFLIRSARLIKPQDLLGVASR